jgi:ribosomal protein S18 acetylase RimI-like enzyme
VIEPISDGALAQLVDVHLEAFKGYMNASIGSAYVRGFLWWFSRRSDGIALAAVVDGESVGYVVGAPVGYERAMSRDLFWVVARSLTLRPWLLFQRRIVNRLSQRAYKLLRGDRIPSGSVPDLPEPVMSLVGIGVSAAGRGTGVGGALMREFESRCLNARMRSMRLSVYSTNTAARKLYERAGWSLFVPEGGGDAVYYYRILDSVRSRET